MALISRGLDHSTYQELSEYRNVFSCLICLEFFSNPRVLECHHIFCENCLETYYRLFSTIQCQEGTSMRCPTCRQLTTTLTGGPLPLDMTCAGFLQTKRKISRHADQAPKCDSCSTQNRSEPALFYCKKCSINMCRSCRAIHDHHHLFIGHVVIHVTNKETLDLHCETHSKMISLYFCLDCETAICPVCILQTHSAHQTSKLRDVLSAKREHLKNLLNQFGPMVDKLEARVKKLNGLNANCVTLKIHKNSSDNVELIQKTLENNPGCSKSSNMDVLSKETNTLSLADRRVVRSVSSPDSYITGGPIYGKKVPVLTRSSESHNSDWYKTVSSDSSSGNSNESLLQFSSNSEVNTILGDANEGTTFAQRISQPDHEQEIDIRRYPALNCAARDGFQNNESESETDVLVLVKTEVFRHRKMFNLSTKILDISQSKRFFATYEDMVARIRTLLELEMPFVQNILDKRILALTRHQDKGGSQSDKTRCDSRQTWNKRGGVAPTGTEGCCKSMLVRPRLIWKVEKQRSDVTEMWNPCDVTFLPDETAIVAEYDNISDRNNKLQLFDRTGRPLAALAQGRLQPLGVAVTREGHIAVTDCKGKRIKILTTTGQTVTEIGKGQFGWPYGIAVNSRGQLIVTDAFNDTISIFQMDGKKIRTFGSTGSQNSQFRNPYHVTVDSRDDIIVSDSGNGCIKVFDSSGKFRFCAAEAVRKSSIDYCGGGVGVGGASGGGERVDTRRRKLRGPRGVTIDPRGNILVADDCCRVCMFDAGGRFVRNLLNEEDSVKFPEAVHCSPGGLLAVTEWNPNNMFAVKMFSLYE